MAHQINAVQPLLFTCRKMNFMPGELAGHGTGQILTLPSAAQQQNSDLPFWQSGNSWRWYYSVEQRTLVACCLSCAAQISRASRQLTCKWMTVLLASLLRIRKPQAFAARGVEMCFSVHQQLHQVTGTKMRRKVHRSPTKGSILYVHLGRRCAKNTALSSVRPVSKPLGPGPLSVHLHD